MGCPLGYAAGQRKRLNSQRRSSEDPSSQPRSWPPNHRGREIFGKFVDTQSPPVKNFGMAGGRKTVKHWNDAGHAHALTFSCFKNIRLLARERSRRWAVDAIDRARTRHRFHLWAYVIMPDHMHILLWPTQQDYSIAKILNTIKQSVSKRALAHLRQHAPDFLSQLADVQPSGKSSYRFWQRGCGYDRNLMEPGTIWATVDYIHANPVRAGLCAQVHDWVWSSAIEWHRPGHGMLRIDRKSMPCDERR